MIQYTVEDIMRDNPCPSYTRERVIALWGGEESLSPLEIARLPIPVQDRVWALGRLLYRLSPHRVNRVVRCIALDIADLWDPPDVAVWYLGTCDEQSRSAARSAALAAASDSAWSAARAAAWSAARSAALAAASDSALAAASDAAWSAAWAAAWAAASDSVWSAASWYAARAAAWDAAMRRYLSWIVKAFDPFMPIGDISS
jgi:hypothetical protein